MFSVRYRSKVYAWITVRLPILAGIVEKPTSDCVVDCQCHDECKLLSKMLEEQTASNKAAVMNSLTCTEAKDQSEQYQAYEKFSGEMGYIAGMLRECPGRKEV